MLNCMGLVLLKASLLPAVKPLVDVISNYNQQDGKLEVQKLIGKKNSTLLERPGGSKILSGRVAPLGILYNCPRPQGRPIYRSPMRAGEFAPVHAVAQYKSDSVASGDMRPVTSDAVAKKLHEKQGASTVVSVTPNTNNPVVGASSLTPIYMRDGSGNNINLGVLNGAHGFRIGWTSLGYLVFIVDTSVVAAITGGTIIHP